MKLWDLGVKLDMKSTGAAEREALLDIADMIGVRGKSRLLFDERGIQHIYVVTGDLVEKEEIQNLWQIEHGDLAKDSGALALGIDLVPEDINPDQVGQYFDIDAGEIKRMLHEAYGRFSDMGKNVVEGIVQGVENRTADCDKDIADVMREVILKMLKTTPTNLVDREKAVETLGKMVDVYLRFRKG